MNNLKKVPKIFLYISVLSGALWLGSYFSKLLVFYQFFEPKDFILKPSLNEQKLHDILVQINPIITLTLVLYLIFIISFFLFVTTSKVSLKRNGWLFITTVIIFLTFPFELYLITIDYKIINSILSNNFNSMQIIGLIVDRFKVLSSFPVIELFCYFAVVYLIIFKPFTLSSTPVYEN
jgi:hypothetical protein